MMNAKNIIKNMIMCIILTRIMCYNPFIMMKMSASMTRYHPIVKKKKHRDP